MWNSYIDQVVAINDVYFHCFLMWVSTLVHDAIRIWMTVHRLRRWPNSSCFPGYVYMLCVSTRDIDPMSANIKSALGQCIVLVVLQRTLTAASTTAIQLKRKWNKICWASSYSCLYIKCFREEFVSWLQRQGNVYKYRSTPTLPVDDRCTFKDEATGLGVIWSRAWSLAKTEA